MLNNLCTFAKNSNMAKKIKKEKVVRKKRIIDKPFSDGTMSNAGFFSFIRSALRQKSRWFLPIKNCKERQKLPYIGTNKRRKWLYRCEGCLGLFDSKEVNVHHIIECGELNSFEDLPGFVKRLFCDSKDLKLVCSKCHDKEHGK
jgi:hypothetical protein